MQQARTKKIGIAGGCLFLFSIILQYIILPSVIKHQMKKKNVLKKGKIMREIWGKFPFAIDCEIYVFNITNPDEVSNGGKATVKEIGPFHYDKLQDKVDQIDHEEDDSVSYALRNFYYFNEKNSNGLTGEEEVIVPNFFVLGIIDVVSRDTPKVLVFISTAIDDIFKMPATVFMKVKVKDLLFDGLPINCNTKDFAAKKVCAELKENSKSLGLKELEGNKYLISIFGELNGTKSAARTRVYRGTKNIMEVGKVVEYNGKPNISTWNNKYCDRFIGTDGTVFHPFFNKKGKEDIASFNPVLCRNIICKYESKSTYSGLKLLRYTADVGIDPEGNTLDKCYCDSPDHCLKKGAFDAYKCQMKPIVFTNPHFYLSDPYYLDMVRGLDPNKEKHITMIDFDAFTGSPVIAHQRAQVNMFLKNKSQVRLMKNISGDILLPIVWQDEVITLPESLIREIKFGHKIVSIATMIQYVCMFGGLGICGFSGYAYFKFIQNQKAKVVINAKKFEKIKNENIKPEQQNPSVLSTID